MAFFFFYINIKICSSHQGYNPQQFKGTNTGVFVGFCNDETDHTFNKLQTANEYAALNTLRCISANRISYLLDLRGMCEQFMKILHTLVKIQYTQTPELK